MKKFLSLVLALVMTMSLVTVSAGAKDFTDNSKINYKEAVDVMSAVKVIDGYSEGDFRPSNTLTRGAAAKIICNLILGPTTASALVADTAPYSDVPTTNTFAGYIAYCAKEGIISGYADGTFRPANTLSGYAFMKMLLGALGYDATTEGYTGPNWSINVAKRALHIELDDGLNGEFNGAKAVNREEACLYAFNTLKATMVEYENNNSVTVNGITFTNKSTAKEMANTGKTDGNIGSKDGKMQFAEKYFTDLKDNDVTNDFAQPAIKWTLKAEKIGTYDKTADQTYTGEVKLGDIYSDLNMSSKDSAEYYIDGTAQDNQDVKKGNDKKVGVGNGATTYVYHDDDTNDVTICTVNTYVGTVSKSVAATKSKDAYIVVANASDTAPANFDGKYETDEEFEDDDVVLYTFSESAKEIKSVKVAEKVTGEVTKIVTGKSYTLGGTVYKISKKIGYDGGVTVSTKSDYNFYLDNDGNVIYVEEDEFVSSDYAMVLAIEGDGAFTDARVKLLKADGSTKTYDTDKNYTKKDIAQGDIVTWSYDEKADEVTLKEVAGGTAKQGTYRVGENADAAGKNVTTTFVMENSKASIKVADKDSIYANSKTVFVVKNNDGDWNVYTGIKGAPDIKANGKDMYVAYYCKTADMATVMFIDASADGVTITGNNSKTLYLAGESQSKKISDKDSKVDYYEVNAVIGGEVTVAKVAADLFKDLTDKATVNKSYIETGVSEDTYNFLFDSYTTNNDGVITGVTKYNDDKCGAGTGTNKISGEYTVKLGNTSWTVAENAKIWLVDEDGEITSASIKSVKKDANDTFIYTTKDGEVTNLFIQEVKDSETVKPEDSAKPGSVSVTGVTFDTTNGYTVSYKVTKEIVGIYSYSVKLTTVNGALIAEKSADVQNPNWTAPKDFAGTAVVAGTEKKADEANVAITFFDKDGNVLASDSALIAL